MPAYLSRIWTSPILQCYFDQIKMRAYVRFLFEGATFPLMFSSTSRSIEELRI